MSETPQMSPPAQDQATKSNTPEETREELREAIKGSREILATATTVFPLFPDTITVDRAKFTVTKRSFIKTAEVMSMRIEDILNVTASIGPVLGSIKIVSRVMNTEQPYTIGVFWRKDAIKLKQITQGYVIALQREIDCSALSSQELSKLLEKLGEDDH
jgi:predicted transcriptional regulator